MTHSGKSSGTFFALLTLFLFAVLFYLYVDDYFDSGAKFSQTGDTLLLRAARDGHFYADGSINGHPVRFMVDTGATSVALSEGLARQIGLAFGAKGEGMTANGLTEQWLTVIDDLRIGEVGMARIPAAILPNMDDDVLLGMAFLRHFDWQQKDGELRLSPK
ncbi:MAG: retropepsin-like aspartic protease [Cardiobacteriaceae bacterium]|nr:retropepsin-like aspartic protease [Cardiobacteriaceae bacterium]